MTHTDARERLTEDTWEFAHWTYADQIEAFVEGWAIAVRDGNYINHRVTSLKRFNSDEEAVAFVAACAAGGSEFHRRALVLHVASCLTK